MGSVGSIESIRPDLYTHLIHHFITQWEQRNTQFQTLMLAATVMFGGGLGVIVQARFAYIYIIYI